MTTGKLSDTRCRSAKPRNRAYKLTDGGGMHLLVQPSGSKLWRLAYRFDGTQRTLSFGPYPRISLADARKKRQAARDRIEVGIDPTAETAAPDEGPTFKAVAGEWFAVWKIGKDQAHVDRVKSRLDNDILPAIGTRPIAVIEPPEVLAVVRKVEDRGALDVAKRVRGHIGQVFRYGIAAGHCKRNQAADIGDAMRPRKKVRHFSKIPLKQLPEFLARLARYDGDAITRMAVRWTLLTWVRTSETRFARKAEIEDLDGPEPMWRIPAERMKMKREHLVPLSPQAVALARELLALPAVRASDYLFPSELTKTGTISENTMLYALYRLGYSGRQTIHGFRGLASTWANEALMPGCDPMTPVRRYHEDWVEMQLAHADEDEVREAYNSAEYIVPRRAMLSDWGALIEREEEVGLLLG